MYWQVSADDVVGVNIIVFRRMTQMDISGNVECNATADYINTLKVFIAYILIMHTICSFMTIARRYYIIIHMYFFVIWSVLLFHVINELP